MSDDPWLTEISPDDIEAAMQRKAAREALIVEQAAEITRLRAVSDEVRGYLSRLLQSLHPAIDLLPNVLGVCTQIDNVLAGQREEITLLRAALATARREGMEMPDAFMQWVKREMPPGTVINSPEWWASKLWTAARRDAMEGFGDLVAAAHAEATKAMQKYPQPNYVISKIAEEAGEVVKAAIHCAEKRETAENVAGEMKQLIAMLIRLWIEGDQVHGLPPIAAAIRADRREER